MTPSYPTRAGAGMAFALTAAATFATSGAFATSLLATGWSPAAAVTVRVVIAAVVLTVPAVAQLRGRWHLLRSVAGTVVGYGLVAVVACQLCYFEAVQRLDVGVALLLEYLGGVGVVGWLWLRHGQRPGRLTVIGAVTAMAGLVPVLGVTGSVRLDPVGVLWGLGAAVGCGTFYVLSAQVDRVPPLVMAWAGMTVGAVGLLIAGAAGVVPLRAATADVRLLDHRTSWLVPVLGLALVAAVVSYVTGIAATRRLGPRLASFVGLAEVLFAVVFAWLFLGQLPTPTQLAGGFVIVAGIAVVRVAEPTPSQPATNPAVPAV